LLEVSSINVLKALAKQKVGVEVVATQNTLTVSNFPLVVYGPDSKQYTPDQYPAFPAVIEAIKAEKSSDTVRLDPKLLANVLPSTFFTLTVKETAIMVESYNRLAILCGRRD
jgi:hypothetical protein